MNKKTLEATIHLCNGIESLLHVLTAEHGLRADYQKLDLFRAARELRTAAENELIGAGADKESDGWDAKRLQRAQGYVGPY